MSLANAKEENMYYKSISEYLKNAPDSAGKDFVIRFLNTPKPDFEKMGREVREFDHQLAAEQTAKLRERLAAEFNEQGEAE